MQGYIATLVKEFSKKGKTDEEINAYVHGIVHGMQILSHVVGGHILDPKEEKTDPMFTINWNYMIEKLTEKVDETIEYIMTIKEQPNDN